LLPPEALTNPDWECEVPPNKPRARPKKTSNSLVQEREDWILQDDIDLPIGLGNDDILDNEEDDFGTSDDYYLSAEEDDGAEYEWEEDTPYEQKQSIWPPEMLHAPSTSRKRRCKRKAPIWPALDDNTYVSLANAEEGHCSQSHLQLPQVRDGQCNNTENALILLPHFEYLSAAAREKDCIRDGTGSKSDGARGHMDGAEGEMEGAREKEGATGERDGAVWEKGGSYRIAGTEGMEVGRGWGALHLDGLPQRYTPEPSPTLGSSYQGLRAVPRQQPASGSPTCGMPDGGAGIDGHVHAPQSHAIGFAPELDFDEEDIFYDNLELAISDSQDEEQSEEEVEVQQGSRRQPTVVDENSIKHLFREETWSQSTNEYAQRALPFIGDPPSVKKIDRRMPSFLHLFSLFWTREVLRNICIETNRYARVV
jgi:hypothetical protein